jgi:hypothetical protein
MLSNTNLLFILLFPSITLPGLDGFRIREDCDYSKLWLFDLICSVSSLLPLLMFKLLPAKNNEADGGSDKLVTNAALKGGFDRFVCSQTCVAKLPAPCKSCVLSILSQSLYETPSHGGASCDNITGNEIVAEGGVREVVPASYQPPMRASMMFGYDDDDDELDA